MISFIIAFIISGSVFLSSIQVSSCSKWFLWCCVGIGALHWKTCSGVSSLSWQKGHIFRLHSPLEQSFTYSTVAWGMFSCPSLFSISYFFVELSMVSQSTRQMVCYSNLSCRIQYLIHSCHLIELYSLDLSISESFLSQWYTRIPS